MKIENTNLNPIAPQQKPEGVQPAGNKGTQAVSSPSKDRAELSDQARLLAKARLAAHETSDVRTDKVQELKQRVNDGTYTIPLQELAAKLLPIVSSPKD